MPITLVRWPKILLQTQWRASSKRTITHLPRVNTACRDNSVLAAKLISQNSDMTIGGQLLRSLIQTGDPVIINFHVPKLDWDSGLA